MSLLSINSLAQASHPLRGDDAKLIGIRMIQVEILGDYFYNPDVRQLDIPTIITIGMNNKTDLIFSFPSHYLNGSENKIGIGDISVEYKYQLFNNTELSLCIKPVLIIGSSDWEKGFGNGKHNYGLSFVTSKFNDKYDLHFNVSLLTNYNNFNDNNFVWNASLAGEFYIVEEFVFLVETGISKSVEEKNKFPVYGLIGTCFQLSDQLALDVGLMKNLNVKDNTTGILCGVSFLF